MLDSRVRVLIVLLLLVIFGLVAALAQMSRSQDATPREELSSQIRTEAVGEFMKALTASAPPPTSTVLERPTAVLSTTTAITTTPGCLGLRFVRDVTIPDNTEMDPAQVFTKTWQVENSGTCAWKSGYQVTLIGGLAMGGSPYRVAQDVRPGGSILVSIKMVAPTNQSGIVQGTWKLTDEAGAPFGDYLSVVIVVQGRTPPTPTRAVTTTP